jgi:hypothetical protein
MNNKRERRKKKNCFTELDCDPDNKGLQIWGRLENFVSPGDP